MRARISHCASFCRWGQFPICLSVCLSVRPARATSQIWEQKRCSLLLRTRQPKFLHRPKRLRCDSDPAGAATPQTAPPTRAPAGRRPTDARHSRHARSRSHHGHRSATVTPESLQAAGKLPCATTLSSLDAAVVTRRRRRVTSFAFPSGGAPTGASLHLDRLPLQRRRPRRRVCGLRRLRPALPASSPMCAETCNWASDADCDDGGPGSGSARPGPTACGTGPSYHVHPGVLTASWEVTGVLYRGGVIKLPRARSARVFCPPQARKFWRC